MCSKDSRNVPDKVVKRTRVDLDSANIYAAEGQQAERCYGNKSLTLLILCLV
jgi:hypothetical protein